MECVLCIRRWVLKLQSPATSFMLCFVQESAFNRHDFVSEKGTERKRKLQVKVSQSSGKEYAPLVFLFLLKVFEVRCEWKVSVIDRNKCCIIYKYTILLTLFCRRFRVWRTGSTWRDYCWIKSGTCISFVNLLFSMHNVSWGWEWPWMGHSQKSGTCISFVNLLFSMHNVSWGWEWPWMWHSQKVFHILIHFPAFEALCVCVCLYVCVYFSSVESQAAETTVSFARI